MIEGRRVRDYMTAAPATVTADTVIHDAIALLLRKGISGVPVVDAAGTVVGMLTEKDCFRVALDTGYFQDRGGGVGDYMTAPVETVDAETDIATVAMAFLNGPYRRFPVTSGGRLVGILSRRDALAAIEDMSGQVAHRV